MRYVVALVRISLITRDERSFNKYLLYLLVTAE